MKDDERREDVPEAEVSPPEPSVETLERLVLEGELPPSLLTVADPPKGKKATENPEVVPARPLTEYERLLALARESPPGAILEDDPLKPYYIGVWGPVGNMFPNLCCRQCTIAILANRTGPYNRQFMEHWTAKHDPEDEEVPSSTSGLVGPSGRPL